MCVCCFVCARVCIEVSEGARPPRLHNTIYIYVYIHIDIYERQGVLKPQKTKGAGTSGVGLQGLQKEKEKEKENEKHYTPFYTRSSVAVNPDELLFGGGGGGGHALNPYELSASRPPVSLARAMQAYAKCESLGIYICIYIC